MEPFKSLADLPYGLRTDGTLAHVMQVPSGLACGCVCPACGTPLVARKGKVVAHHFAHHADKACAGAWESALHILAKEVIAAADSIALPEAVAVHEHLVERIAASVLFAYESAQAEVHMGAITPDIVVRGTGRTLLVEVHVTHPAEDAKVEELRRRELPAIEIDLSRAPRHASRDHHAALILRDAPRRWLFNAKVEAAVAKLRETAEREEADRQRRRRAQFDRVAAEAERSWSAPAPEQPEAVQVARDMGAEDAVGLDVPGSRCFAAGPATWQACLLEYAALQARGREFNDREALRELAHLMKNPFARSGPWDPDLVAHIGARVPGFATPEDALAAYVRRTRGLGWVERQPSGALAMGRERAHEALVARHAAEDRRRRRERLRGAVTTVVTAAGLRVDVGRWMATATFELPDSPLSVADHGGAGLDRLVRHLQALERMVSVDGADPADDLLGLPLQSFRARRAKQQRQRRRRQEDASRRAAAEALERRRLETAEFLAGLTSAAATLLGAEGATAWVTARLEEAAGPGACADSTTLEFGPRSTLESALSRLRSEVYQARAAEEARAAAGQAAAAKAALCKAEIQRVAERHFLLEPDKAELWLRGLQRSLGASPRDYCTDDARLERCRRLLAAGGRAGRL